MFNERGRISLYNDFIYSSDRKKLWKVDNQVLRPLENTDDDCRTTAKIYVMKDHDSAGRIWDKMFMYGKLCSGATMVHIDAHDDLAIHGYLPESMDELNTANYEVGSFILPRVNIGMIGAIYWVHPKRMKQYMVTNDSHAAVVSYPHSIISPRLRIQPQVVTTPDVPHVAADLLDIDLDFFTAGLSDLCPNIVLKMQVSRFMQKLTQNVHGVKMITIATSPGYIQSGREKVLLETVIGNLKNQKVLT